jgi:hypothetical protein
MRLKNGRVRRFNVRLFHMEDQKIPAPGLAHCQILTERGLSH